MYKVSFINFGKVKEKTAGFQKLNFSRFFSDFLKQDSLLLLLLIVLQGPFGSQNLCSFFLSSFVKKERKINYGYGTFTQKSLKSTDVKKGKR